jgi:hypothetical protein
MWINKPEHIRQIKPTGFGERIELGSGDTAQVTKEAGEYLINNFDGFTET